MRCSLLNCQILGFALLWRNADGKNDVMEEHIAVAIKGVREIMRFERTDSYIGNTGYNELNEILFNEYIPAENAVDNENGYLDYSVLFVVGLDEFSNLELTQFRMYVVINLMRGEKPKDIPVNNVIWLQSETDSLFSVYEKQRGKMKMIFVWNGNYFLDAKGRKHASFSRTVKGEVIRVGSTIFPPHTFPHTDDDGILVHGGGVEVLMSILLAYSTL